MEKPNYYSVLTADVRYDKRLSANEKLFFAEITALTNMNGKCFATNKYFSELYCVEPRTISRWISNIVKCGYIEIKIEQNEQKQTLRYITLCHGGDDKNVMEGDDKNVYHNNNTTEVVCINNTLTESNIKEAMEKWVAYKKERKQKYTATGLKQCFEKLKKLSNDNPIVAMQIVNESISNNWAGLFPLKKTPQQTKSERINKQNLDFLQKAWGL